MNAGIFGQAPGTTIASALPFIPSKGYRKNAIVLSTVNFQFYARKVAGSGLVDPSADSGPSGAWTLVGAPGIKSIEFQKATILTGNTTGDATFANPFSLSPLRTVFALLGLVTSSGSTSGADIPAIEAINTTTVRATVGLAVPGNVVVNIQAVTYYS